MTLTDEQIRRIAKDCGASIFSNGSIVVGDNNVSGAAKNFVPNFARAIEAALSLQGEAVPVAEIWALEADGEEDFGVVRWLAHNNKPIQIGDELFTSPPLPTAQQSELIRKCAEIVRLENESSVEKTDENWAAIDAITKRTIDRILALLLEEGEG